MGDDRLYALKESLNLVRKDAPQRAHAGGRPTHLNLFFSPMHASAFPLLALR